MSGTASGQAAYEAYRARITDLRARYSAVDFPSAAPQPWDGLSDDLRSGWEAAAAAGAAGAHERTAELVSEVNRVTAERDELRERITSLARYFEVSAAQTSPSKKSEIERHCAKAIRELVPPVIMGAGTEHVVAELAEEGR